MKNLASQSLLCLTALAAACGGALDTSHAESEDAEAWSAAGNPAIFGSGLEYKFASLATKGAATQIPWTGSYWPTANDNINYKWAGPQSDAPSTKYGKAFGVTGVEDAVSRYHGIDSQSGKACKASSECSSDNGEICARRAGQSAGKCIPTWFGICHGWTPASILMPEPKHAVIKNGVTFNVADLKALASLVHDRTSSKFVSLRCEQTNRANGMAFDKYGRPADETCRDSNAGTYHLLLGNYLGKGKAFAEDRTQDSEVWNQPLRAYRVTSQKEVTAQEANRLIGVPAEGGVTTQKSGALAKDAWAHQPGVTVAAGQTYSVKMTGTGDADLYVRFGAQPAAAKYDCRPYANGSAEECSGAVPAGATQLFVSVSSYGAASTFALSITVGGAVPGKYVFNSAATRFVVVKTEVDYISESSPEADGYLTPHIDSYTRTDQYDYVLELNAAGAIVGGEWIGQSKQAHPDFLWLPTGVAASSVAGGKISYAAVKALMDESIK